MEPFVLFYLLIAAPSATDNHVMNYAVPLAIYDESEQCADQLNLLNSQAQNLPTHLWCMPVGIPQGEQL